MDFSFDIHADGPVFDGRAKEEAHLYGEHLVDRLSQTAVNRIKIYLPAQYMYLGHNGGDPIHNPVPPNAGFLQASIHTDRVSDDIAIVTDDPVTYGAWIEGIDAMNLVPWRGRVRRGLSPRFPGYHTFRIIAQQLDAQCEGIALSMLPPYIDLMNA